ncbi:hypothetical protein FJU30_15835 [Affinibrenneria salicis]|uniref:Sialidase domain-containing protein n=1 Tax=Affinibrenneria salicis TaxID=2590031 RepID=A0A5J5FXM3_9GAMM|nr:exo-alpha-sialidase [Affinibrenneria salicis]KAA8998473.1 hypothetical protein FJU30_15835 [Affinibrenneria salicis]
MALTQIRRDELIPADRHYFASCHASTLVTLPDDGLLAAWFAGEKEGSGDTAIWLARYRQGGWSAPRRVLAQPGLAHWNPVLHRQDKRLWLFYKTGPDVHRWLTRVAVSDDDGVSWSPPRALVAGDLQPRGPVKNKLLVMSNGEWLAGASVEDDRYWDAFVDISADWGRQWRRVAVPLRHIAPDAAPPPSLWQGLQQNALWENDLSRVFQWDGVIQPTAWESRPGHIHLLMRSTRGCLYRSDSADYGRRWSPARPTELANNNSGIDLAHLGDGRLVLACNPIAGNWSRRYPLSLIASADNGMTWRHLGDLENEAGEFSYPAIIAGRNSLHITYTCNRTNIIYQNVAL